MCDKLNCPIRIRLRKMCVRPRRVTNRPFQFDYPIPCQLVLILQKKSCRYITNNKIVMIFFICDVFYDRILETYLWLNFMTAHSSSRFFTRDIMCPSIIIFFIPRKYNHDSFPFCGFYDCLFTTRDKIRKRKNLIYSMNPPRGSIIHQ